MKKSEQGQIVYMNMSEAMTNKETDKNTNRKTDIKGN